MTTSDQDLLPTPPQELDPGTEPYWRAADEGRLVLPRCETCAAFFWYPRAFCPACGGGEVSWVDSPGTGTVYTFTAVRRAAGEWAPHAPYLLAHITLDEGITVPANLIGLDPAEVRIGLPVRATFQRRRPADTPVLRFEPHMS